MARTRSLRFVRVSLSVLGVQLAGAATLGAQAWVPPAGEGTVSVTYQNYYVTGHFDPAGRPTKNGGTTLERRRRASSNTAVTDTIGLSVSLPLIASKYTGSSSYIVRGFPTFPGPLDDGSYHAAVQDLRVEARRVFVAGPVAVAPFVGAMFPTHDYETVGEAVPGRHRRELQLGASVSALLDPVLPGAVRERQILVRRGGTRERSFRTRTAISISRAAMPSRPVSLSEGWSAGRLRTRADARGAGVRLEESRSVHCVELRQPRGRTVGLVDTRGRV